MRYTLPITSSWCPSSLAICLLPLLQLSQHTDALAAEAQQRAERWRLYAPQLQEALRSYMGNIAFVSAAAAALCRPARC